MKIQRHFEIERESGLREATQIRTMLLDLDRTVQILDCDIATEEKRVRVSDPFNAAYPILARALTVRRDNLKVTIAALEERLAKISQTLPEAVETAA
jgi:hypothetical protein